ncbi:UNVERIFIED_CONTAM: hypothetical protein K2H54_074880 [Gekko kuhli]
MPLLQPGNRSAAIMDYLSSTYKKSSHENEVADFSSFLLLAAVSPLHPILFLMVSCPSRVNTEGCSEQRLQLTTGNISKKQDILKGMRFTLKSSPHLSLSLSLFFLSNLAEDYQHFFLFL